MNVSIGQRWETFVENAVKSGRYASASEVMREGLRLVEEREAKLRTLHDTLDASMSEDGRVVETVPGSAPGAKTQTLVKAGF